MNDRQEPVRKISERKVRALMQKMNDVGIGHSRFFAPLSASEEQLRALADVWPEAKKRKRKQLLHRAHPDLAPHALFNPQFEGLRLESLPHKRRKKDDANNIIFDFIDNGWSISRTRSYCLKHDYRQMTNFCKYDYVQRTEFYMQSEEPCFRRIEFRALQVPPDAKPEEVIAGLPPDHILPSARVMMMALLQFSHHYKKSVGSVYQYFLTKDCLADGEESKRLRVGWFVRNGNPEIDVTFRFGPAWGHLWVPRLIA